MRARSFSVVEADSQAPHPNGRFRLWVNAYTISRVSRSLGVDRRVVHTWVQRDNPVTPALRVARKLIALSVVEPLNDGPLTYEDIFGEVKVLRRSCFSYGQGSRARQIVTRRLQP